MRDEGLLNSDEPFTRLLSQGMVLNNGVKMSKSKDNVVDPQGLIERYGADTVRLFIIFAAPPDQSLEWSESGVEGAHRFLKRLWAFAYENRDMVQKQNRQPKPGQSSSKWSENADPEQLDIFRQLYDILDQAKFDYERQQYNTVVSACMKIFNLLAKVENAKTGTDDIKPVVLHQGLSILLRLLAPIAPHITHQLWLDLQYPGIILEAEWPKSSGIVFKVDTVEMVVQVNGNCAAKFAYQPVRNKTS